MTEITQIEDDDFSRFSELFIRHAVAVVLRDLAGTKMSARQVYARFEAEIEVLGADGGLPYPSDGDDLDEAECRDRCARLGLGHCVT